MSVKLPEGFQGRKRDALGLLEGIGYVFYPDYSINWRAMVPPQYLAPNAKKTTETDTTKLSDDLLILLLQGIKELANLRGFKSVEYRPCTAKPDYFATVCRITFVGNYETEGRDVVFEAIGDASDYNTEGFGKEYKAAVAENRAFCRCVRNFLRINIVSKEELKDNKPEEVAQVIPASDPLATLQVLMTQSSIDFEKIKETMTKDKVEGVETFQTIQDIPTPVVFNLIDRISKKLEKKATKKRAVQQSTTAG